MNIKPLGNHVIIKGISEDTMTKAGIVLPDTADKERPEKGEVVAVGPGRLLDSGERAAIDVTVGQTVIFKKYSPDEIKVDGQDLLVLSETDIIAIVE